MIPVVWNFRNILISGLSSELVESFEVYYGIPKVAFSTFKKNGVPDINLFELESARRGVIGTYIFRLLKRAHAHRNPVNTTEIFGKFKGQENKLKSKIIYSIPSSLFRSDVMFNFLQKIDSYLNLHSNRSIVSKLKEISPAFVMSTANVVESEWPIFRVAQALGIKTYSHVLSFDNLTSRGYLPISEFDKYFVWNSRMKEELMEFYSVSSEKIFITGTPQFDFHNEFISRENTLARIGLHLHERYIVYCANHFAISPNEPILLNHILKAFQSTEYLRNIRVVLRLHPMDDYNRWNEMLKLNPTVILSIPWKHEDSDSLFWGEPSAEDIVLFSNILRHGSVVLNIASTIAIDAAITDTPVVCIGFHPTIEYESKFYNDVHYSKHYAAIMETKATPLINSLEGLVAEITDQLEFPDKLKLERNELKNRFKPQNIVSSKNLIKDILLSDNP